MTRQILVDTSFLLALWNRRDIHHRDALSFIQMHNEPTIVPAAVLVEVFFMLNARMDYRAAVRGFEQAQSGAFQIEPLTADDMQRMAEIMRTYSDSQLDYVDTAIMALAERLNITRVCTFDRRDFTIFRPKHTNALTLLP